RTGEDMTGTCFIVFQASLLVVTSPWPSTRKAKNCGLKQPVLKLARPSLNIGQEPIEKPSPWRALQSSFPLPGSYETTQCAQGEISCVRRPSSAMSGVTKDFFSSPLRAWIGGRSDFQTASPLFLSSAVMY